MKLQMEKNTLSAPILQISEIVKNKEWHEIDIDDFDMIGYFPHSKIHAKMSA
jgi:thymidylate synthase